MTHWFRHRGDERLADVEWDTTIRRVRGEFEEMPGLRVTLAQARMLFGLSDGVLTRVMNRLTIDGFLESRDGEYVRRMAQP